MYNIQYVYIYIHRGQLIDIASWKLGPMCVPLKNHSRDIPLQGTNCWNHESGNMSTAHVLLRLLKV